MSQETFDLADLKEGEEFTEEISIEDDSGKETLVARSTFKVPKDSVCSAAARSGGKMPAPFLVKTEYFSEDFQPKATTRNVSAQGVGWDVIWKYAKPIGEWILKEWKTEAHNIVDKDGNTLATPEIGILANHAEDHDYFGGRNIYSDKVNIKVRNWNQSIGVDIKGIRMNANVQKTDKAEELLSDGKRVGLPGAYIKQVYVTVESSRRGHNNYVNGYVDINDRQNGHASSSKIFDAYIDLEVHFKYGATAGWKWGNIRNFHFTMKASEGKIKLIGS